MLISFLGEITRSVGKIAEPDVYGRPDDSEAGVDVQLGDDRCNFSLHRLLGLRSELALMGFQFLE